MSTRIHDQIQAILDEFGENPFGYFWVLQEGAARQHLDFARQNERHDSVRRENWHSLRLEEYELWAISDNGDLLWWNGQQTIAMTPRDSEFFSAPVTPAQFFKLLRRGAYASFFPEDLLDQLSS